MRIDAELYPEVVDAGGLLRALVELAERNGVDLDGAHESPPLSLGMVTVPSDRGGIHVGVIRSARGFTIAMSGPNWTWARGTTADLPDVVEVAGAWRGGMLLRELTAAYPFLAYDALGLGYEDGDPVSAMWGILLAAEHLERQRPLLRAAFAHPRLRPLMPGVSHGTVRLKRDHLVRDAGEVTITEIGDRYGVGSGWFDEDPELVDSLTEAIELAVLLL
ncbi:DUF6193 family natural product biosynthesis protein [Catellatospora tritici]|uniref:DUF6193 family natural product biosynthesis protein n=1 Tax=Catellatospora tritici TaxID=2851566 RepID=UPI001C2DC0C7|nr:DUF6193 family natural product biosynthesis protein [Catellatospora tritici]MBV1855913.1 hypothetical protein [Catellatospora tritici]